MFGIKSNPSLGYSNIRAGEQGFTNSDWFLIGGGL